jgi:thioesterase domain-containing protein
MKAIGVDGTEPPLEDIRLIATRYVKEILAERPEGPYVIGGYSVGGVIAFETALQLQAMGKVVSRVIAFDTLAPGYPKPMPMLKRVREHARVFRNMKGKRKLHYLGNRIDQMKKRILFRLNLHRFYAPPIPGMKVVPQERLKHVWGALYKAREAYLPSEHFNGRVILVSSEQTDQWIGHYYDDPHKGWNRWCDEVQLYVVPAEHMLFFRDDNIELLSSQMREILRQVATESRISKV